MAKLDYFSFKKNEELMSDELVQRVVNKLEEKWAKIAKFHEENNPEIICRKCSEKEFEYYHNKAICKSCRHEIAKEISHQEAVKIGCASRTFLSNLKEFFAGEMGRKAKEAKPSSEQLRNLPISLETFSEIEYTEAEIEFLNRRYSQLLDEVGRGNYVDQFMVYKLVQQELKLLNMDREDKFGNIKSADRKRELEMYRSLVKDLKAAKSNRSDVEEQTIIQELAEKAHALELDKEIQKHVEYLETDFKDYLKMSKERREKKGNSY